jgi:group I intron endonuclease
VATEVEMSIYKPGVYGIRHIATGKIYVGSCTYIIKKRWISHRSHLNKGTHHNRHLQNAWIRYGEEAFEWVVLENCGSMDCIIREQYWIDITKSANKKYGYNICKLARSCLGVKHSNETKKRISSARKGNKNWLGRKHSDQSKSKMSTSKKGKVLTDEHKLKISLNNGSYKPEHRDRFRTNNPMKNPTTVSKMIDIRIRNRETLLYNMAGNVAPEARRIEL